MKEQNSFSYFPFTPIANSFIEFYMAKANPLFVVIYIFLLHKFLKNEKILLSDISNKLDVLASDIIKALNYWKDQELVKFEINADIMSIEFIDKKVDVSSKVIVKRDISYTEDEINFFSTQDEIQQLFRIVENKFAKTLSYQDRKKIIEIFDGYGLSMESFVILITYCKDKGKTNFNYISKVALDWAENGIDSIEKIESYIKLFDEDYKKIMRALGFNSEPAPAQAEFIRKWVMEFKIPVNIIEEACRRATIKVKDKGSYFEYADGILKNLYKKNINTMEQLKANDDKFKAEAKLKADEFKNRMEKANSEKVYQANRKNKFVNFEQPKVDFGKLRELEIKSLKGEL